MRRWICTIGFLVAGAAAAQPPADADRFDDEAVLRDQRLPTKGPGLLTILRDRTPPAETIARFHKHLALLKSADYATRVKASANLKKIGAVVRPLLVNFLRDAKTDAETAGRVRLVVDHFPPDKDSAAASAAARLIARDKPANSVPVLLDFVPYATDEAVRQDVQHAINLLAGTDKNRVVASLKDASAARRAAAGEALVRNGLAGGEIEPLFKDAHPLVRHQIGLALVEKHDKRGLPLLIESLGDVPPERIESVLDVLQRAAGENTPEVFYEGKQTAAAVSAAWQKWHAKHHANLDLAKALARSDLGFTVISTTMGTKLKGTNKVFEIGPGPEHALHWEFEAQRSPIDVQIVGPNRLLVAEYYSARVTERDFKGNVLKQFAAALPIACQRLPSGHTFIASRRQLLIVDPDGKNVFTWTPQAPSIAAAQRLRNGHIAVVSTGGMCQLLDAKGKELKSFLMGGTIYTLGGNIEVLPNGRVLAPLYNLSTVVEFDWNGNKRWQANVNRPTSATRLPNGHTLVTCMFDNQVVEIDANGKQVWSYQTDGRPMRARRR